MSHLRIAAFKDGQVIKQSTKNPEWGTAMVIGETITFNNGIMNSSKRIGFLRAPLAQLEALGLRDGEDINAKLKSLGADAVKIVRKETLEPAYNGHQPKVNPTTNEVIKDASGNPIYMQDLLVNVGSGESDELIPSGGAVVAQATEAGDEA